MPYKHESSNRGRHIGRWVVVVILLGALGAGLYANHKHQQHIKAAVAAVAGSASVNKTAGGTTALPLNHHFDTDAFAFDAPTGWRLIKHDSLPYNLYSYRASHAQSTSRYLDIYVDKIPQALAVNRAIALQANGARLTHGLVSPDCTSFTTVPAQTTQGASPLSAAANWDGIAFLCETDNSTRNVVGSGAAGTINQVILTGANGNKHALFFVYTDASSQPDYTVLYKILDSFTIK